MRVWERADLQLLEHAPDAMVVVDDQGVIVFANSQTEAVFGYSPSDLIGQPIEVMVPRSLRGGHQAQRARYQAEPHVRPMGAGLDLMALRNDGVEIPIDISLSPLSTSEGLLTIAAVRDISDRKKIERDLRAAHQRLHRDFRAAANLQQSLLAALQSVALTRVLSAAPWPSTMLRLIDSPASVVGALNNRSPSTRRRGSTSRSSVESWMSPRARCATRRPDTRDRS